MSNIRRALWRLFGHQHDPGINPEMSIYFHCSRCGELAPGELAYRRARR